MFKELDLASIKLDSSDQKLEIIILLLVAI